MEMQFSQVDSLILKKKFGLFSERMGVVEQVLYDDIRKEHADKGYVFGAKRESAYTNNMRVQEIEDMFNELINVASRECRCAGDNKALNYLGSAMMTITNEAARGGRKMFSPALGCSVLSHTNLLYTWLGDDSPIMKYLDKFVRALIILVVLSQGATSTPPEAA